MNIRIPKILGVLLLCQFTAFTQVLVPEDRRVDWSTCGLLNEVDTDSWPQVNLLDYGPANDATTAFEALFLQVPRPVVVYAPAGTYTISSSIYLPSNVVVRGDGPGQTVFQINTPSGAEFRDGFRLQGTPERERGDCRLTSTKNTITTPVSNAYSIGAFTLDVPDASIFRVGDNIEIEQENNAAEITDDTDWAEFCKGQLAVITEINGNTLTLDRSLTATYFGNVRIRSFTPVENIGLENFTIEAAQQSYNSNIGMEWAANCWILGVESRMCDRDHIRMDRSRNIEIRGCYVHDAHGHGAGGFGYGIRLSDHSCDSKVEDCIMRYLRHGIIVKEGSNRNVYGYNYVREGYYSDGNHFPADISLHGHWSWLNLFEGNIVGRITVSDAWGRTGPNNLIFRNRSERAWHISVEEASHDQVLIANEMVEPYLRASNGQYFCGADVGTEVPDYEDNTWCSGSLPYQGDCVYRTCKSGPDPEYIVLHEEPDITGTLRYSNRNFFGYVDDPITDLPNSYYLCGKPDFFEDGDAWPSIGPEFQLGTGTIPARLRWHAFEQSNNLNDLFPDVFCRGSMAQPTMPATFSLCSGDPAMIESGLTTGNFQWYFEGNEISGGTQATQLAQGEGVHGIRHTENGCIQTHCVSATSDWTLDLGPQQTLCSPTEITLTPSTDASGLSYDWSTGDTTENILVSSPGTYTLTASSSLCPEQSTQVVIASKTFTPLHDTLDCSGGEANFSTVEGQEMHWFTTPTGGTSIHTGETYTETITENTTYYAELNAADYSFNVGPVLNDLVPTFSSSGRNPNEYEDGRVRYRVEFSVFQGATLETVDIYVRATNTNAQNIQLNVEDAQGNPVGSAPLFVWTPPSTGHHLVTVPIGLFIPPGIDYSLHAVGSSTGSFQWQFFSDGGVYPYTDAEGIVEITRSYDTYCTNTDDPFTFFFNWNFSLPGQLCDRVPVHAVLECVATTDCNGVQGGSAEVDLCGICAGGNTGITPNSSCHDCHGDVNGTAYLDSCGTCVEGNTGLSPCTQDCANDWGGTATLDLCGICSGGNTGITPNSSCLDCHGDVNGTAYLDSCGTCVEGNTGVSPCTQDCFDDWGGTATLDLCGICSGGNTGITPNSSCLDCRGDVNGTAYLDSCGTCVEGNTGLSPCTQDCANDWGGSATTDLCGVCSGGNTGITPNSSCLDCHGDINGTAYLDNCGTCVEGNTGLTACAQDCNGDFNGSASIDLCGICSGGNTGITPNTTCLDCLGDVNGSAYLDSCGTCVEGNSGLTPCTPDCNGDYNGNAAVDLCGTCSGGNTGVIPNSTCLDCNGDINGDAYLDNCGTCVEGNTGLEACTADCHGDLNGTATLDLCGVCSGGNTGISPNTTCLDCHGDMNGTAYFDSCGTCVEGNTGLEACAADCNGEFGGTASIDLCGVCSGGNTGVVTNSTCLDCHGDINGTAYLDNCGSCVEGNTGLEPCAADCNGDLNGSATLDLCGVCSGGNTGIMPNSTCLDCHGDVNGSAYLDNCGTCVGGNSGLTPCIQDCNGDFNGTATMDLCGVCTGGNTGITPNSTCLDCNGEINGSAYLDSCNTCVSGTTGLTPCMEDCYGDFGGFATIDLCGVCSGGNTGLAPNQDTDNDGTIDCEDDCPEDPNKTIPGACGCGVEENCSFRIPNTFTPNGDDTNDHWHIVGADQLEEINIQVFNRWGNLVFSCQTTPDWDGKKNGKNLPSGTYYFILNAKKDGKSITESGDLNIIR